MNDRQLECFMLSATNLSFHKTAELLYITQPGVSHLIKALETELGFQLFDRRQNRIFLTAAGEHFYQELVPAYTQLKNAIATARLIAQRQEEKQLVYYCHLSNDKLPMLLQYHESIRPKKYELSLLTNTYVSPVAVLKSGVADLAFCMKEDLPDNEAFIFIPFHELDDYCVVHKDHPLTQHQEITFKDLQNQTILNASIQNVSHAYSILLERITAEIPSVRLRFFDDEAYMNAVLLSGGGICISPLESQEDTGSEELRALPLVGGGHYIQGVAYLAEKESPELLDLVEEVKAVS